MRSNVIRRRLLTALALASTACGCAGGAPPVAGQPLNPSSRADCPAGSLPVCWELSDGTFRCRCEQDDGLGAVR